jgi:hypothetical protein
MEKTFLSVRVVPMDDCKWWHRNVILKIKPMFILLLKTLERATRHRLQKWNKKNSALFQDMMDCPKTPPQLWVREHMSTHEEKGLFLADGKVFALGKKHPKNY